MHKTLLIIMLLAKTLLVFSQVQIDRQINLIGITDSLITLKNIGLPTNSSDGISIYAMREKNISFGYGFGSNLITLDLIPAITKYEPGLYILFEATATNTGSVHLSINGLPPTGIKKYINLELDSFDITPGKIIHLIFDGTNFQAIHLGDKECPRGYLSVNENFCIEEKSRDLEVNFFTAAKICMENNSRLCSWSEWVSACDRLKASDNNFTSHWEWVNTSSDHNNGAKIVGYDVCGNNSYMNAELNVARFRCCYTK
jgi:hypothetical protein